MKLFPHTTHALRADGFDASEDGTGRGTPLVVSALVANGDAHSGYRDEHGLVCVCVCNPMNPETESPLRGADGDRTAQTSANGHGVATDTAHTLDGANGQAVVYPILEAGARTGKSTTDPRCSAGIGDPADPMFTLQSAKQHAVCFGVSNRPSPKFAEDIQPTLNAHNKGGGSQEAVVFESRFARNGRGAPSEICPPLKAQSGDSGKGDAAPLVAGPCEIVNGNSTPETSTETAFPLRANDGSGNRQVLQTRMTVRRLTPTECCRLQGFPDGWTLVPVKRVKQRSKKYEYAEISGELWQLAADGPRYKSLGNSMAVPVISWLGSRIQLVDDKLRELGML